MNTTVHSMASWHSGLFMHMPCMGSLEVLEDALIGVDAAGTIASVLTPQDQAYRLTRQQAQQSGRLHPMGSRQLMIPGMTDLHIHAPQWPQRGMALHLPLQEWLQHFTFPLEARYSDLDYARRVYGSLVRTLLANGTTTAMYFATIHEEATELLASTCLALGQRAFVGRVAMDDPGQCPDNYRDADAHSAIAASERSLRAIRQLDGNEAAKVKPVITPRFIPSCTDELLTGLGELAASQQCHVQTHCSESDWEHGFVMQRLGVSDTQALAGFGLLNRHTVLAHSNFISEQDMSLIKEAGSGIAHCPLSNSYFADSVFPLRRALEKSLRVGLGTDIAGGHSASVFNSCQHAVASSRLLESGVDTRLPREQRGQNDARIDFLDAFYLATAGGADVLDSPTGVFAVGRQFDALLLDLDNPGNPLDEFHHATDWDNLLGCIIHNAQRCNIEKVWVDGCALTL